MALTYNVDFKANTSQLQKAFADINAQVAHLSLKESLDFSQGTQSARVLQTALKDATNEAGRMSLDIFNRSLAASNTSAAALSKQFTQSGMTKALETMNSYILQAESNTKQLNVRWEEVKRSMMQTAKYRINNEMLSFAVSQIDAAVSYTEQLNKQLTSISMILGEDITKSGEFIGNMQRAASALNTTTLDYAKASEIFYQQGLSTDEVAKRVEVVTKSAQVAMTSVQDMSTYMTALWNSYNMNTDELERAASVLNRIGMDTAASFEDLATGMSIAASSGAQAGLKFEDLAAMIAVVKDTTQQSSNIISTAFRTVISRIQDLNAEGELGKVSKGMQVIGNQIGVNLSIIDEQTGQLRDLSSLYQDVGNNWDRMDSIQQRSLVNLMGGVRQAPQLLALFNNWEQYLEVQQTAAGEMGQTLSDSVKQYGESIASAQAAAKQAFQVVFQELPIAEILTGIAKVTEGAGVGLAKLVQAVGTGIGGFQNLLNVGVFFLMRQLTPKLQEIDAKIKQASDVRKYNKENPDDKIRTQGQLLARNELAAANESNLDESNAGKVTKQTLELAKIYADLDAQSNKLTDKERERVKVIREQNKLLQEQAMATANQLTAAQTQLEQANANELRLSTELADKQIEMSGTATPTKLQVQELRKLEIAWEASVKKAQELETEVSSLNTLLEGYSETTSQVSDELEEMIPTASFDSFGSKLLKIITLGKAETKGMKKAKEELTKAEGAHTEALNRQITAQKQASQAMDAAKDANQDDQRITNLLKVADDLQKAINGVNEARARTTIVIEDYGQSSEQATAALEAEKVAIQEVLRLQTVLNSSEVNNASDKTGKKDRKVYQAGRDVVAASNAQVESLVAVQDAFDGVAEAGERVREVGSEGLWEGIFPDASAVQGPLELAGALIETGAAFDAIGNSLSSGELNLQTVLGTIAGLGGALSAMGPVINGAQASFTAFTTASAQGAMTMGIAINAALGVIGLVIMAIQAIMAITQIAIAHQQKQNDEYEKSAGLIGEQVSKFNELSVSMDEASTSLKDLTQQYNTGEIGLSKYSQGLEGQKEKLKELMEMYPEYAAIIAAALVQGDADSLMGAYDEISKAAKEKAIRDAQTTIEVLGKINKGNQKEGQIDFTKGLNNNETSDLDKIITLSTASTGSADYAFQGKGNRYDIADLAANYDQIMSDLYAKNENDLAAHFKSQVEALQGWEDYVANARTAEEGKSAEESNLESRKTMAEFQKKTDAERLDFLQKGSAASEKYASTQKKIEDAEKRLAPLEALRLQRMDEGSALTAEETAQHEILQGDINNLKQVADATSIELASYNQIIKETALGTEDGAKETQTLIGTMELLKQRMPGKILDIDDITQAQKLAAEGLSAYVGLDTKVEKTAVHIKESAGAMANLTGAIADFDTEASREEQSVAFDAIAGSIKNANDSAKDLGYDIAALNLLTVSTLPENFIDLTTAEKEAYLATTQLELANRDLQLSYITTQNAVEAAKIAIENMSGMSDGFDAGIPAAMAIIEAGGSIDEAIASFGFIAGRDSGKIVKVTEALNTYKISIDAVTISNQEAEKSIDDLIEKLSDMVLAVQTSGNLSEMIGSVRASNVATRALNDEMKRIGSNVRVPYLTKEFLLLSESEQKAAQDVQKFAISLAKFEETVARDTSQIGSLQDKLKNLERMKATPGISSEGIKGIQKEIDEINVALTRLTDKDWEIKIQFNQLLNDAIEVMGSQVEGLIEKIHAIGEVHRELDTDAWATMGENITLTHEQVTLLRDSMPGLLATAVTTTDGITSIQRDSAIAYLENEDMKRAADAASAATRLEIIRTQALIDAKELRARAEDFSTHEEKRAEEFAGTEKWMATKNQDFTKLLGENMDLLSSDQTNSAKVAADATAANVANQIKAYDELGKTIQDVSDAVRLAPLGQANFVPGVHNTSGMGGVLVTDFASSAATNAVGGDNIITAPPPTNASMKKALEALAKEREDFAGFVAGLEAGLVFEVANDSDIWAKAAGMDKRLDHPESKKEDKGGKEKEAKDWTQQIEKEIKLLEKEEKQYDALQAAMDRVGRAKSALAATKFWGVRETDRLSKLVRLEEKELELTKKMQERRTEKGSLLEGAKLVGELGEREIKNEAELMQKYYDAVEIAQNEVIAKQEELNKLIAEYNAMLANANLSDEDKEAAVKKFKQDKEDIQERINILNENLTKTKTTRDDAEKELSNFYATEKQIFEEQLQIRKDQMAQVTNTAKAIYELQKDMMDVEDMRYSHMLKGAMLVLDASNRIYNSFERTNSMMQRAWTNRVDQVTNFEQLLHQTKALDSAIREQATLDGVWEDFELAELTATIDNYKEIIEGLYALNEEMLQQIRLVFNEYWDQIDRMYSKFDEFTSHIQAMQNILKLAGSRYNFGDAARQTQLSLAQSRFQIDNNQLASAKVMRDELQKQYDYMAQAYTGYLETTRGITDEFRYQEAMREAQSMGEDLRMMEDKLVEANNQFMESFEGTIQDAFDLFNLKMEQSTAKLRESIARDFYGSTDWMQTQYDYATSKEDRYVNQAQEIYDLITLQRELEKYETEDLQVNEGMARLLNDINKAKEDGVRMTQYDLNVMQERFNLLKAQAEWEDARNAKNTMRLARDNSGNWSYIYSNDQNEVEDKAKGVEDAMNKIWQLSYDRERELADMMMENMTKLFELDQEMLKYADNPEFLAILEQRKLQLLENDLYIRQQYDIAVQVSGQIHQDIVKSEVSDLEYIQRVRELGAAKLDEVLGRELTDLLLSQEGHWRTRDIVEQTTMEMAEAWRQWEVDLRYTTEQAGIDFDNMASAFRRDAQQMETDARQLQRTIEETTMIATQAIQATINKVRDWAVQWHSSTVQIIADCYAAIDAINALRAAEAGMKAEKNGKLTQQTSNYLKENSKALDELRAKDKAGTLTNAERVYLASLETANNTIASGGDTSYYTSKEWIERNNAEAKDAGYGRVDVGGPWDEFQTGIEKNTASVDNLTKTLINGVPVVPEPSGPNPSQPEMDWSWGNRWRTASGGLIRKPQIRGLAEEGAELVLNAQDTVNMLAAINSLRGLVDSQMGQALIKLGNELPSGRLADTTPSKNLNEAQPVVIQANFPSVTARDEIQAAFNNLLNQSTQYSIPTSPRKAS